MSDGGQERALLGVGVLKSYQKWSVRRSAVRSIAWLGLFALKMLLQKLSDKIAFFGAVWVLYHPICDFALTT